MADKSGPTRASPPPGEAVPKTTGRRLERPPGERYRPPPTEAPAQPSPAPDLSRAVLYGLCAVAIVAVVWLVAGGALGLTSGLVAVALACGWLIGVATASGARREQGAPLGDRRGRVTAVALAVLAWVLGTYLAYLWKLAAAADTTLPLAQRLADQAFAEWLLRQFTPIEALQILAVAFFAWRAAR